MGKMVAICAKYMQPNADIANVVMAYTCATQGGKRGRACCIIIRNPADRMRKALFRYRDALVRIELKCLGDSGSGWTWDVYINGQLQFCGEDAPFAFAEEAMAAAQQTSRHMIDLLHASL